MARYIRGTKPLFIETPLWDDAEPHRPDITVADHEPVDTGLVWSSGEPIIRAPLPIGFGRDEEW